MIDESQLRKWLFPLYHGTDIRIVKMSKEERQSFKEDCIKVADYLWGIYKDSFDDITNGKYRAVLGETRWLNLYNALTVGKLNHEGCDKFQYDTFQMSKLRFKAERYARKSFAFGEIGLIAYRMYDAARILNFPIHTYSDDIQRAALRIAQFAEDSENVRPVIFKINDLDMDLLEVESLGTLQDFVQKRIDVIPDLLQKKNDTFDMVLHYKGEVNLNPSDEIYL